MNIEKFNKLTEKEKDICVLYLFKFQDKIPKLKMLLNDLSEFLNQNSSNDIFLKFELQVKEQEKQVKTNIVLV